MTTRRCTRGPRARGSNRPARPAAPRRRGSSSHIAASADPRPRQHWPVVDLDLRHPTIADHLPVVSVVDEWWGGFHVAPLVQNLFFELFSSTSFVEDGDDGIRSFLLGFDSADEPDTFYIHFVGVRP